jgi:hypothetical protein
MEREDGGVVWRSTPWEEGGLSEENPWKDRRTGWKGVGVTKVFRNDSD